jgi:hypothetical protein
LKAKHRKKKNVYEHNKHNTKKKTDAMVGGGVSTVVHAADHSRVFVVEDGQKAVL